MSELYTTFADKYDAVIQQNIFNTLYDFPSMTQMIGEVDGLEILDLGCGSGVYANYFLENGAKRVVGIDASEQMVEILKQKLGNRVDAYVQDLSIGLPKEASDSFDLVVSALMIHYIEDLKSLFSEVRRVLKPNGVFAFSTHHPFADFDCSESGDYFQREFVSEKWDTVGEPVEVQFYRRSLSEITNALKSNGFAILDLNEGAVSEEASSINIDVYKHLKTKPNFLFIKAMKL